MKLFRNPSTVHPPLAAYSHQVDIRGTERMLALSGQVGMRPDGSLPDDPIEQLEVAMGNLANNLAAAGMGVEDLFKITLYIVGEMDAARRREVIAGWLGEHHPCMTLVQVVALATPKIKVEIDGWASREG